MNADFWLNRKVKAVELTGGLSESEFNIVTWPREPGYVMISRFPKGQRYQVSIIEEGEYPDWRLVLKPISVYPKVFVDEAGWSWVIERDGADPEINQTQYFKWKRRWRQRIDFVSTELIRKHVPFTRKVYLASLIRRLIEQQNPLTEFPFSLYENDDRTASERRNDAYEEFNRNPGESRILLTGEDMSYIRGL